jgi:hypothetical protein
MKSSRLVLWVDSFNCSLSTIHKFKVCVVVWCDSILSFSELISLQTVLTLTIIASSTFNQTECGSGWHCPTSSFSSLPVMTCLTKLFGHLVSSLAMLPSTTSTYCITCAVESQHQTLNWYVNVTFLS